MSPNAEHHYPGYIWITLGWYQDDWWRGGVASDDSIRCTSEDLEPFIRRTLSIQIDNSSASQTDVGLVSQENKYVVELLHCGHTLDYIKVLIVWEDSPLLPTALKLLNPTYCKSGNFCS